MAGMKKDFIKIGHLKYEVIHEDRPVADNQLCRGTISWRDLEIALDTTLKPPVLLQTLLHEVTHAIDDQYNLGLTENQIDNLASGWAQVLIDNPEIMMKFINPCLE